MQGRVAAAEGYQQRIIVLPAGSDAPLHTGAELRVVTLDRLRPELDQLGG